MNGVFWLEIFLERYPFLVGGRRCFLCRGWQRRDVRFETGFWEISFRERERRCDIFKESFLEGVLEAKKTRNQRVTFF